MPTRRDVIELAYRCLGIKAEDQPLSADEVAFGGSVLDGLWEEVRRHAPDMLWPLADVPNQYFLPLAYVLAAELAPSFGVASRPRGLEFARLMAAIRPDNRPAEPDDGPRFF
jgi:hypothetical protein